MKPNHILFLLLIIYGCNPKVYSDYDCKINQLNHSTWIRKYDFSEHSECISKDSLVIYKYVKNSFANCFCSGRISNINKGFKGKKLSFTTVEPLFIDSKSCTGLYSQRIRMKNISVSYLDRKFPHSLFLIDNGRFTDLTNLDSIEIKNKIYSESSGFEKIFQEDDLDRIYKIAKLSTWWNYQVVNMPQLIIDNGEVVFDANKNCLE